MPGVLAGVAHRVADRLPTRAREDATLGCAIVGWVGHSRKSLTLDTYAHVLIDE
jgi:hypothetical protein